jgi:hypothetical protein|tara:strand:- start:285 stop:485 length:201 start_codon:yes stop_codon:yes gene_type:complete
MDAIWDILTRLVLTAAIFAIFWYILELIVFENITGTTRDLLFIIIGAFLTAFGKVVDYWFTKNHKE